MVGETDTKSCGLLLPPKPQTWLQQAVLWGTLWKRGLAVGGQVLAWCPLGMGVRVPMRHTHCVCLWMCLLLSYPADSPSCFQPGEEG